MFSKRLLSSIFADVMPFSAWQVQMDLLATVEITDRYVLPKVEPSRQCPGST